MNMEVNNGDQSFIYVDCPLIVSKYSIYLDKRFKSKSQSLDFFSPFLAFRWVVSTLFTHMLIEFHCPKITFSRFDDEDINFMNLSLFTEWIGFAIEFCRYFIYDDPKK